MHAAEVANEVAAAALTVTGGYGYHRGPIERSFRDARAAIASGLSNIIARDWIGKSLVGLPLELFYEGENRSTSAGPAGRRAPLAPSSGSRAAFRIRLRTVLDDAVLWLRLRRSPQLQVRWRAKPARRMIA
ncbi:acyl-CoA dehydrogenase family protein [Bradyrhizobium arachidis]|uniref:acyl-CoA dehydrogenase family protein n=1 Tax=Bradyrhizobium arachidis TaxID=858423 RepID=UPI0021634AF8|nr:acyl-CoA dehydrogenase family protein [Bradyrhizobium arachidis]